MKKLHEVPLVKSVMIVSPIYKIVLYYVEELSVDLTNSGKLKQLAPLILISSNDTKSHE